jgi:predicted RNase H-like nuclease
MRYIGIDLAWGTKNTTAAVVLEGADANPTTNANGVKGAKLTAYADALTDDDSILAFVAAHDDGGGLLVAIDAPTWVPNETGRRPCEALLAQQMRRYDAGPHPANRTLLAAPDGTIRGERLVVALEKQGIAHTPYFLPLSLDTQHPTLNTSPRACFEVFPHPAHVVLFGLEKTLKYKAKKGGDAASRQAAFRRYAELLGTLQNADPPLEIPPQFDLLRRDPAALMPRDLKRHEDTLDALTCAYVALYRHRWGDERTTVLGDLTNGYIVVPHFVADLIAD